MSMEVSCQGDTDLASSHSASEARARAVRSSTAGSRQAFVTSDQAPVPSAHRDPYQAALATWQPRSDLGQTFVIAKQYTTRCGDARAGLRDGDMERLSVSPCHSDEPPVGDSRGNGMCPSPILGGPARANTG
eukprot:Hpha_TRINITY_DN11516_c0_g1::TRINITY_DN11516_c0_g1_i3::g.32307::m.32307